MALIFHVEEVVGRAVREIQGFWDRSFEER